MVPHPCWSWSTGHMQSLDVNRLDTIKGIPVKAPKQQSQASVSSTTPCAKHTRNTAKQISNSHHARHSHPAPGWSLRWIVNSCTDGYCSWRANKCQLYSAGVACRLHGSPLMATNTPHSCLVQAEPGRSLLQATPPPLTGDAALFNTVGALPVLRTGAKKAFHTCGSLHVSTAAGLQYWTSHSCRLCGPLPVRAANSDPFQHVSHKCRHRLTLCMCAAGPGGCPEWLRAW